MLELTLLCIVGGGVFGILFWIAVQCVLALCQAADGRE